MSEDLNDVLEGPELGFGGLVEDGEFLGGGKDFVEMAAGRGEI